jgi:hypothetical protein
MLHRSGVDCGTGREKTKTYGRFFGMIFFGGALAMVAVEGQRVATEGMPKIRKNAKKSVIFLIATHRKTAKESRPNEMTKSCPVELNSEWGDTTVVMPPP